MSIIDIDDLYGAFCTSLPDDLKTFGGALAVELGLAPDDGVAWSGIFKHDITLNAPLFFAEGAPAVEHATVARAVQAHMLSVIGAFASDRVADGQVRDTPELARLLAAMRAARDAALVALAGPDFGEQARRADAQTEDAILAERALLAQKESVSPEGYRSVSAGKQAVGLVATRAFATSLGWSDWRISTVERTLLDAALGLQFQDDVVDWQEDATRGGAWAVALGRHFAQNGVEHEEASLEQLVLSSGVQAEMLELARTSYVSAAEGARALGALRLSNWAAERAADAEQQRDGERRSPGFVARSRKLGAWKAAVLG
jgi:hypothetical protein